MMELRRWSILHAAVIASFLSGCAHDYLQPFWEPLPTFPPAEIWSAKDGLDVSVDEFASAKKSLEAFAVTVSFKEKGYEIGNVAVDVGAHGVLPLRVSITNRSAAQYRIQKDAVTASLAGGTLLHLSNEAAADTGAADAYSKARGRDALLTAMIIAVAPLVIFAAINCNNCYPVTRAAPCKDSLYHTCTVNNFRERFRTLELRDAVLQPGEAASGFVYFKLPEKLTRLENLTAEITLAEDVPQGQSGKSVSFKFTLPPVQLATHE
jgi:hypothetical protein